MGREEEGREVVREGDGGEEGGRVEADDGFGQEQEETGRAFFLAPESLFPPVVLPLLDAPLGFCPQAQPEPWGLQDTPAPRIRIFAIPSSPSRVGQPLCVLG